MRNSGTVGRALARQLLAQEATQVGNPRDTAASGRTVCEKLFAEFEQFIGHEGFKVLLARALHLAKAEFSSLAGVRIGDSDEGWLVGLTDDVPTRDVTDVSESIAAVLGGFIDLLGTFIGYDLTWRMINRRWPEVPRLSYPGEEQRDG